MKKVNNIAVVLSAGSGTRMGNTLLPKQFLSLSMKPIFIMTLEKVLKVGLFDKIVLVINEKWIEYVNQLLENYSICLKNIDIVYGGSERLDSINNAIEFVEKNYLYNDPVIVFFDSVRPFISDRIIENSVKYANQYGVAVAGIGVKDTIYEFSSENINSVISRDKLVSGQAPDSFKLSILKECFNKLTEDTKRSITGTIQICLLNGYVAYVYPGDENNFKITTKSDYMLAKILSRNFE